MVSRVRSASLALVALLFATGLPGLGTAAHAPAPDVADRVDWWPDWGRDQNGDGVDDAIAGLERHGAAHGYTAQGLPRYSFIEEPHGLRYHVFVRFAPGAAPDAATVTAAIGHPARTFAFVDAVYVQGVRAHELPLLLALPQARAVELERTVVPTLDVASQASLVTFSDTYGNGARGRYRVTGLGAVIAVLDTGVDQEHEAFSAPRFIGGFDATLPPLLTVGVSTPLNEVDPDDDSAVSHGTHVAGIALGLDPDQNHTGMAPDAKLLDVKVMRAVAGRDVATSGTTMGLGSMVLSGLEFVLRYNRGETYLGDPGDDKVDIVSMSLGELAPDPDGSSILATAVNQVALTGVHVVAAAGNCGPGGGSECCTDGLSSGCAGGRGNDTIPAPGSARLAITVGAMGDNGTVEFEDDTVARFSSRGPNGGEPKPNLLAYGVDIHAPQGAVEGPASDGYHALNGTSMAAPMIAGILALMLEADPTLTPERAKILLMKTARDVGEPGWDTAAGAGVVNAYFAVGAALGFLDPDQTVIDEGGKDNESRPPPSEDPPPQNISMGNRPPKVAFDLAPNPAQVGDTVVLVDKSYDPDLDKLVAWTWDFGDGETGHGERVSHVYERAGTYTVKLSVTDIKGTAGSARTELVVQVGPGAAKESPDAPVLFLLVALAVALVCAVKQRRRTF